MEQTLFGYVPSGQKRCARCHKYKNIREFNYHAYTEITHRQPYCRDCQREYAREHSSHRASVRPEAQRSSYNELYAAYKAFRARFEAYKQSYGDDPTDRLTLEYDLGL